MATVVLGSTTAEVSGKNVTTEEGAHTITGLHTFDRDPSAPFAVTSGSAVVTNLNADTVDGYHAADLGGADPAGSETITGLWSFSRSTSAPFAVNSGAAVVSNLDADKVDGQEASALYKGYAIQFHGGGGAVGGNWDFLASSTYYISHDFLTPTSSQRLKLVCPVAGTVTAAGISLYVNGTLASSGNLTIALRQNTSTDTTLSSSLAATAAFQSVNATGLSITLAAGDTLQIKVTTPAWSTAPTECRLAVVLYVKET